MGAVRSYIKRSSTLRRDRVVRGVRWARWIVAPVNTMASPTWKTGAMKADDRLGRPHALDEPRIIGALEVNGSVGVEVHSGCWHGAQMMASRPPA